MGRNLFWIALVAGTASGAGGCGGGGGGGGADAGLGPVDMIDDLEDGDDAILAAGGRQGAWSTFHDETKGAVQTPSDTMFTATMGGADGSKFAAATTGMGFTDWGAGMGLDLNAPDEVGGTMTRGPYDASKYKTIAFSAKGNVTIWVGVEISATSPTDQGGTCTPSTVAGMECEDLHGLSVKLTPDWHEYTIPYAELKQQGWGKPVDFDPKTMISIQFQVDANLSFDYAIDNVRFYQ
jgi:hypothetical protein